LSDHEKPAEQLNPELAQFFHLNKEDLTPEESRPIYSRLEHISNRYQINQLINQGGMKRIYEAMDHQCNRLVALAKPQKNMPKDLYESFLREAQLTASLEHPNIAPVYDISVGQDQQPFFVMELIHGEDLESLIEKLKKKDHGYLQKYSQVTLLDLFVKLCDAVSYAHSKNVLHLDLKPANIQIGQFGEILVCDWGLAKIIGQEDNDNFDDLLFNPDLLNHYTLSGQLKGTPGYMAPEQIEPNLQVEKTADIYALGALLYTLLTYHPPIEGQTETVLQNTVLGNISPIATTHADKNLPSSLIAIVEKAMALRPEERYISVEQLQQDVRYYLAGYATKAENAGFLVESRLFYRRNTLACNLSALAISLIITLMAGIIVVNHLQESNKELWDEYSEYKTKSGYFYFRSENFFNDPKSAVNNAILEISDILNQFPDHRDARLHLQHAYFISHQFDKCMEAFRPNTSDGIYNLAKNFVDKIDPKTQRLPPKKLLHLIELLLKRLTSNRGPSVAERMVAYTFLYQEYDAIRVDIVKLLLKNRNPKWDGQGFSYREDEKALTLSSKWITNLGDRKAANGGLSFLRFMEIDSLNLSATRIQSFEMLRGLNLKHLNIANTPIQHLHKLHDFKLSESITISKGQFKKGEMNYYIIERSNLKVISIDEKP
jgi:serine/threonine-protein kinase